MKILADPKTDRLLGAQIIGFGASELIPEAVTVMEFGGSAKMSVKQSTRILP